MPTRDQMRAKILFLTGGDERISERPMFGGYGYFINGNMFLGASSKGFLMVRPPRDGTADALPGAREPVKGGFLMLGPEFTRDDANIRAWYKAAFAAAEKLPAK
jgi:TfoX/Sxy family transcriptional regulator of competence genes